MRIFAVAHRLPPRQRQMQSRGQRRAFAERHVPLRRVQSLEFGRDLAVVARRERERLARQLETRREAQLACGGNLIADGFVVRRIGHHANALKILRRGSHHRRARRYRCSRSILPA